MTTSGRVTVGKTGVWACAAVTAAFAVLAPAAWAAFPGHNGKLAFGSGRDYDPETGERISQIYVAGADGSAQTNVSNTSGHEFDPAWSPDGSLIAFEGSGSIYVMDADGANKHPLVPGDGDPAHALGNPAWSPDGTRVAFKGITTSTSRLDIYAVNADGSGLQNLTNDAVADRNPSWSPDGTRIAYSSGSEIFVMDSDGSNKVNLTNDPASDQTPEWSPDGSRIAFASSRDDPCCGFSDLYSMRSDGSDVTRLTFYADNQNALEPTWSPDGSKIAFTGELTPAPGEPNTGMDVLVMNADGSSPAKVIASASSDRQPSWQPIPVNGYPHPRATTALHVSLVPAYDECTAPNRTHGAPLVYPSCSLPARSSQHLTVGTSDANGLPARSEAVLRLKTIVGDPSTPADEADVAIRTLYISDVYTNGLTDYAGELRASIPLRVTDKDNTPHPGGPGAATTEDFTFDVDVPCAPVTDPQQGSVCQTATTADALIPGAIKEGRRAIWQLGQIVVYDGGPDGDTATEPNTVFARQGVFIP